MFDLISRLRDPAIFQGSLSSNNYFEGWYFKHTGRDNSLAVIPGVSLTEKDKHAFIQVFDSKNNQAHYFRYPVSEFNAQKTPFSLEIAGNQFSYQGVELNIDEKIDVHGRLEYSEITRFDTPPWMRGVMGWYGFTPFMETYHGILSMDHYVDGIVMIDGEPLKFHKDKGYIEKDWGTSFPSAWIWMQGNRFIEEKTSLMFSVAVIPWLSSSFIGHLAVLYNNREVYNLSTYKGGKLSSLKKTPEGLETVIETKSHRLYIEAIQGEIVRLRSPIEGVMNGVTEESITSSIKVKFLNRRKKELIYSGEAKGAGLEIMDPDNRLNWN